MQLSFMGLDKSGLNPGNIGSEAHTSSGEALFNKNNRKFTNIKLGTKVNIWNGKQIPKFRKLTNLQTTQNLKTTKTKT